MLRIPAIVCALAVCFTASVAATTYLPVTFDDLVAKADVIFVGEVVDVRAFALDTRDGTIIKTRVTFRVDDPLLASTGAIEVLEFLGGETGGVGMAVAEMPTFAIGDRRVVFARRERSINPIVGFTQGVLRIAPDGRGVDRVLTLEGQPLARIEAIGKRELGPAPSLAAAMRLSEFRDRVVRALREARH
jgi:hypothetical protein